MAPVTEPYRQEVTHVFRMHVFLLESIILIQVRKWLGKQRLMSLMWACKRSKINNIQNICLQVEYSADKKKPKTLFELEVAIMFVFGNEISLECIQKIFVPILHHYAAFIGISVTIGGYIILYVNLSRVILFVCLF